MFRLCILALAIVAVASAEVDPKERASVTARKNFWSFRKPVRPDVPPVASPWVRTPIDAFILEALRAKQLTPSPELGRAALLRRVTLDLTGLPPLPAEVTAFLADKSPGAYDKAVDRLMASPHYGERWAQRWLDVARYADTNGYELDAERPHAWRYRDYVVHSFNANKPFDRFLREQIAGDELYPGDADALVATGFHRAGPIHLVGGNQDEEMNRQEVLTEMTAGVSGVFLGLTVGCAKCHNHKFDPILQSDYYRLQATLGATEGKDTVFAAKEDQARYEEAKKTWDARIKEVENAIKDIEKPYRDKLRAERKAGLAPELKSALDVPKDQRTEEQKILAKDAESQSNPSWDDVLALVEGEERVRRTALRKKLHDIEAEEPAPPGTAYAVANMEKAPPTHILKIGDHRMKLGIVEPGVPLVLALAQGRAQELTTAPGGRRSELAEWLASPDHPLTARVFVNRMWQFRMGRGIVRTPNDFGTLGERPTHPKLLDWLATELIARNWDIKAIDRLIVTSSAYRQSAGTNRRRLEGEAIRDSILSVTGQLNLKAGGPPIKTPIEPEIYDLIFTEYEPDNLWPLPKDKTEMNRRSIYLLNKRTVRLPMLANFDQPDAMTSCAVRPVSTHALQALSMMNSDFMQEQSKAFAARLKAVDKVGDAYRLALARGPRPEERRMAKEFFAKGGKLQEFCLALINRNEFVYIP